MPNLISQLLTIQQGFDVDFGEHWPENGLMDG
jgi:hypothetical protein